VSRKGGETWRTLSPRLSICVAIVPVLIRVKRNLVPVPLQSKHAGNFARNSWGCATQPLDAALARPRHVHAYNRKADAARLAAAYGFGIVRNHPFTDGNKRAGFLAIGLFLALNGYELAVDQVSAVQTIFRLAAGDLTEQEPERWIRQHIVSQK
jgi:death-on-curing protein